MTSQSDKDGEATQDESLGRLIRIIRLLVIFLFALIFSFWELSLVQTPDSEKSTPAIPNPAKERKLEFQFAEVLSSEPVELSINPMIELDFKPKQEILDLRKKYVMEHPDFVKKTYHPSPEVFGEIVDKAAWWGIEGIYHYGPGEKSIEGPSEETRFIANPFLLVGLCEFNAFPLSEISGRKDLDFPNLLSLKWEPHRNGFYAKYDVSRFLRYIFRYNIGNPGNDLTLDVLNARDFGYEYLFVDPAGTTNVTPYNTSGKAVRILEFLHLGRSCGYPGGGNNSSPEQKDFHLKIGKLPAKMHVLLWRSAPSDVSQKPDMNMFIDLE